MATTKASRFLFRVVMTCYEYTKRAPYVDIPTCWKYPTHDAASDAIEKMVADELETLNDGHPEPDPISGRVFESDFDGEDDGLVRMADNVGSENDRNFWPITRYNIHTVEQSDCYDKNSQLRPYWKYRDYRIYTNANNNRFKVLYSGQYMYTRHSLENALLAIDRTELLRQYQNGDA